MEEDCIEKKEEKGQSGVPNHQGQMMTFG